MENYLSDLFAIVLAVLVFTLYPASRMAWMADQQIEAYINAQTESFADSVRHSGYINRDMYESFVMSLAKTGYTYDIKIMHIHKVFYPLSHSDTNYSEDNKFSSFDEVHPYKEIIKYIYSDSSHEYKMNSGDSISIDVTNKVRTKANIFFTFLSGSAKDASLIQAHDGGMITNENY